MAASRAGAFLHTMAILQWNQVNLLRDLDEGEGVTDLSLRTTKEMARAIAAPWQH